MGRSLEQDPALEQRGYPPLTPTILYSFILEAELYQSGFGQVLSWIAQQLSDTEGRELILQV